MDEVEAERDTTEVLIEAGFEESLQPGEARNGDDEEDGGPEEVEPLVVKDGLWLEEREVVPARRVAEVGHVAVLGGHAPEVDAAAEEDVRDSGFVRLDFVQETRKVVI